MRSDLGNLLEVVNNVLVFLAADLNKTLHRILTNLNLLILKSLENLSHDKIAFDLHFEIGRSVWNRMKQGFYCKLAGSI